MTEIRPKIQILNSEQIEQVHQSALEILEKTGIRVDDETARQLLQKAGGQIIRDHLISFPKDLVNWAIDMAPSQIEIFNRSGKTAFQLTSTSDSDTRFGLGVTNLYFQEPSDDSVHPFQREHASKIARLCNQLDAFDLISTPGAIKDLPKETADLYVALEMIANTQKAQLLLVSDPGNFEQVLDLYEHLHGDLSKQPFVIPYFNPITPLVLNEETTKKIDQSIARGLPLIFSNYGMSGATSPVTAAGTLALLTAELLAGLVYCQLLKEKTPVILGSLPSVFNMKTMGSVYSPQTIVLNLACSEMMAHYQVPHCGTSGSSIGWGGDLAGSGNLWMNHLTNCIGKVGLAPFVGGILDSLAFSPSLAVYADEVIRQSRQFAHGFSLDDRSLGLEEINDIGPGGNYLASKTTLKLCRDTSQLSEIWPAYSTETWQAAGSPKSELVLRDKTLEVMKTMEPADDHDALISKGEAFISEVCG